jgi:hypothetical protein
VVWSTRYRITHTHTQLCSSVLELYCVQSWSLGLVCEMNGAAAEDTQQKIQMTRGYKRWSQSSSLISITPVHTAWTILISIVCTATCDTLRKLLLITLWPETKNLNYVGSQWTAQAGSQFDYSSVNFAALVTTTSKSNKGVTFSFLFLRKIRRETNVHNKFYYILII